MNFMSFSCSYALISPMKLVDKIDCLGIEVFADYEDIEDKDCFRLNIFPLGAVISNEDILKITDIVRDYLFDE